MTNCPTWNMAQSNNYVEIELSKPVNCMDLHPLILLAIEVDYLLPKDLLELVKISILALVDTVVVLVQQEGHGFESHYLQLVQFYCWQH